MTTEEKAKAYDEALERARKSLRAASDVGTDIVTFIFPKLRESEDERIRKEIIEFVDTTTLSTDERHHRWIAYLEKQKEQKYYWKPTETDVALFNKAVTTNKTLTPAERAQLDIIRSKFGCCRAVNCSGIVQKEQKPIEYLDKDKIYTIMKKLHDLSFSQGILINSEEYKQIGEITEDVRSLLDYAIEQKPAELSEVELKFRGEKVKVKRPFFRDDKGSGYSTTEQDDWVTWDALRAWAELHGYTPFDLYPRAEWSEEDEENFKWFDKFFRTESILIDGKDIPQDKYLWFKSLRPSWRPSEEQIYSLGTVVKGYNEYAVGSVGYRLKELYEQLKKL